MVDYLGSNISFIGKKKRMQKTSGNRSKESLIYDGYSKNITPKIPKNSLLHLRLLIKVHLYPTRSLDQRQNLLLLHRCSSVPLRATAFLHAIVHL